MRQGLFDQNFSRTELVAVAAFFIIAAGMIHLAIFPLHLSHAPAHGIFLAIAGVAEIAWGIAFWRKPSTVLYHTGMVMAGWLIMLWMITRLFPAPFGHGPETVEIFGIICRLCEGLGIVTLAALGVSEVSREIRVSVWRNIGLSLTLSLILGGFTYGVGQAAELVLTSPDAPAADYNEEHSHNHEPAITPAPHCRITGGTVVRSYLTEHWISYNRNAVIVGEPLGDAY